MKRAIATAVVSLAVLIPTPAQGHFFSGCRKGKCKRHVVRPHNAHLNRMASCESGGRWHINSYHDGGLQFHPDTWRRTGSRYRFAHYAPIVEQKYRAVIWASRIGWAWRSTAGWPNCG